MAVHKSNGKAKRASKAGAPRGHQPPHFKPGSAGKVRMYRQGLGDCFLINLPGKNGKPYYLVIGCGAILGTPDAMSQMKDVVQDILDTTGKHVDLLVATHEHWDHLSGFVQARDLFASLKVDQVWLPWTEDPADDLANQLRAEHQAMRIALASACARIRFAGGSNSPLDGLIEFFGAAG